ncbi:MAG TPA: MFS transporter [Solirubrobacteraceae bacterium]|nr:MFS transporter [Solirubrobacteraceae bacterium]
MAVAAEAYLARLRRQAGARIPVLLRDRPFRRYWSAQTISMFGDQIASLAMPLAAVLVLKANAAEMGYLTALVWLPSLLFGVHAGAWVDRHGHRRAAMIAADLGRFGLLATLPVADALGVLTLPQLYAVAFATGALSVLFNVADSTLFVALVPPDRYVEGNSLIYGSRALSLVGGPSISGLLVQWLTAPFAIAADAVSFLGSAALLRRIRVEEPPPAAPTEGALAAGARFIASSPFIRACLCACATVNFFTTAFVTLFVLYAVRTLHVDAGVLGVVLGAGAVGGLVGAALAKRLSAGLGLGWTCAVGAFVFTAPLGLVPLAGGSKAAVLGMLFIAEFASDVGVMVFDISLGSIFAAAIPDSLRARVTGAFQAVNFGTRPLGALTAGGLATLVGVRPTLWIAVGGATLGFLWLLPVASSARELDRPRREN